MMSQGSEAQSRFLCLSNDRCLPPQSLHHQHILRVVQFSKVNLDGFDLSRSLHKLKETNLSDFQEICRQLEKQFQLQHHWNEKLWWEISCNKNHKKSIIFPKLMTLHLRQTLFRSRMRWHRRGRRWERGTGSSRGTQDPLENRDLLKTCRILKRTASLR